MIKLIKGCPVVCPDAVVDLVAELRVFSLLTRLFREWHVGAVEETLTGRRAALGGTKTYFLMLGREIK